MVNEQTKPNYDEAKKLVKETLYAALSKVQEKVDRKLFNAFYENADKYVDALIDAKSPVTIKDAEQDIKHFIDFSKGKVTDPKGDMKLTIDNYIQATDKLPGVSQNTKQFYVAQTKKTNPYLVPILGASLILTTVGAYFLGHYIGYKSNDCGKKPVVAEKKKETKKEVKKETKKEAKKETKKAGSSTGKITKVDPAPKKETKVENKIVESIEEEEENLQPGVPVPPGAGD